MGWNRGGMPRRGAGKPVCQPRWARSSGACSNAPSRHASMPCLELPELGAWGLILAVESVHLCRRRTMLDLLDQLLDVARRSLGNQFNSTVGEVAHEPRHLQPLGLLLSECPEAHSLHLAADEHVNAALVLGYRLAAGGACWDGCGGWTAWRRGGGAAGAGAWLAGRSGTPRLTVLAAGAERQHRCNRCQPAEAMYPGHHTLALFRRWLVSRVFPYPGHRLLPIVPFRGLRRR